MIILYDYFFGILLGVLSGIFTWYFNIYSQRQRNRRNSFSFNYPPYSCVWCEIRNCLELRRCVWVDADNATYPLKIFIKIINFVWILSKRPFIYYYVICFTNFEKPFSINFPMKFYDLEFVFYFFLVIFKTHFNIQWDFTEDKTLS